MEKIFNDDIKVKINRIDNDETLIDGEFATTYIINVDRFGQISRSYYGLYNEDILKAIEVNSKKYLATLKKACKEKLLEEVNVEVTSEDIPEDKKLKDNDENKVEKKGLSKKKEIYNNLDKKN